MCKKRGAGEEGLVGGERWWDGSQLLNGTCLKWLVWVPLEFFHIKLAFVIGDRKIYEDLNPSPWVKIKGWKAVVQFHFQLRTVDGPWGEGVLMEPGISWRRNHTAYASPPPASHGHEPCDRIYENFLECSRSLFSNFTRHRYHPKSLSPPVSCSLLEKRKKEKKIGHTKFLNSFIFKSLIWHVYYCYYWWEDALEFAGLMMRYGPG